MPANRRESPRGLKILVSLVRFRLWAQADRGKNKATESRPGRPRDGVMCALCAVTGTAGAHAALAEHSSRAAAFEAMGGGST